MKTPRLLFSAPAMATLLACLPLRAADDPCCMEPPAAGATGTAMVPDESIYQLNAPWQNQDGAPVKLADFAGTPVIVTMVFSHCTYACPRIVADLQSIRAALPEDVRDHVRFVLASFDTVRDTPARLHEWAAEHQLGAGWTLLHGGKDAVRELSVLLDIPFVPQPDGSFGHGNRIVLLDAHGVIVTSVEGLGAAPAAIVDGATALARSR
jgi:protein SCO1